MAWHLAPRQKREEAEGPVQLKAARHEEIGLAALGVKFLAGPFTRDLHTQRAEPCGTESNIFVFCLGQKEAVKRQY